MEENNTVSSATVLVQLSASIEIPADILDFAYFVYRVSSYHDASGLICCNNTISMLHKYSIANSYSPLCSLLCCLFLVSHFSQYFIVIVIVIVIVHTYHHTLLLDNNSYCYKKLFSIYMKRGDTRTSSKVLYFIPCY
jgi:hypothetical protein